MNAYGKLLTHVIGISEAQIVDVPTLLQQIKQLATKNDIILQLVDANRVVNKEHLQVASYHAQKSFQQKTATSNSLEIETLLYATGQRQIAKALTLIGISPKTKSVAAIICCSPKITILRPVQEILSILNGKESDIVFNMTPKKEKELIKMFEITLEELKSASIPELIIERMALLELTKKPSQDISKG